jgi:hypothetical protein
VRVIIAVWLAAFSGMAASAQVFQGKVEGVVKDPTGALVAGTTVHAMDEDKGTDAVVKSDKRGEYQFASLLPGTYTIRAEMAGFETFLSEHVTVNVNQSVQLDITLSLAKDTQTVFVNTSSVQSLEVNDASVGQVVTTQEIEELPLAIRSPLDLVELTPGVVLGPDFGNTVTPSVGRNFNKSNFNVGGGKSGMQAILLDGAPDTTGDQGRALLNPPVDAVQEFKVQAIAYDAQFGRTSGGIINMITKSGTNKIHGSVYDFERDSHFNATNYFPTGNTTNYHTRQAGGVLGFPILRDRWFGFVDFESLKQGQPVTNLQTVPTDAERAGDFSALTYTTGPGATPQNIIIYDPATYNPATGLRSQIVSCDGVTKNVICPARISQLSQNLIALYPHGNLPGGLNNANNFVYTANQNVSRYKWDVRSDVNLNGRTTFYGKWARQKDTTTTPGALPPANSGAEAEDSYTQAVASIAHVFTGNLMANVTTSFVRGLAIQHGTGEPLDVTQYGFSTNFASEATHQLPELAMANVDDVLLRTNVAQQHQPRNTYATLGQMTWLHGRHSFKFGGEWWQIYFNEYQNSVSSGLLKFDSSFTQRSPTSTGSKLQGYDIADLLLGIPSGINQVSLAEGSYISKVQAISTNGRYNAVFVQDDWRVLSNLTLNMGLRWDVSIGDREKYNRLAWFDPNAPSPLGPTLGMPNMKGVIQWVGHGNDVDQQRTSWDNVQPRVGFAYHPWKNLVFRGGYGMFFLPRSVQGNNVGALGAIVDTEVPVDGPTPTTVLDDPFPNGLNQPNNDRNPLADIGQAGLSVPTHDYAASYVQMFSLGFQQQLPWQILGDVHYWGNLGRHIPTTANLNALNDAYVPTNATQQTALSAKVTNPLYGIVPLQGPTTTQRQLLLPFTQYTGNITQQLNDVGTTNYNALTLMASRRVGRSTSFTTQYTWGKAMDNLGTPLDYANRAGEYALSALDVTNQWVTSFVFQLPYGHGRHWGGHSNRILNGILGGWNANGILMMQSGFPVVISRPTYLQPGYVAKLAHPTPALWFNTNGVAISTNGPTGSTAWFYGNEPRNLKGVRSDHIRNLDLNIEKNFSPTWHGHQVRTQVRAEAYNALNHPQFDAPIGTFSSASFGQVQSQLNNPRTFQFGIKMMF